MVDHVISRALRIVLFSGLICIFACGSALAGLSHYVPGGLGIKNATMPPPGFWYAGYNQLYRAKTYRDDGGRNSTTTDMDITVFANVNQFAWITDKKIFGANYGVDLFVPLIYTDLEVDFMGVTVTEDRRFGLGDLFIDPLVLCWHGARWDAFLASGAYLPTAQHDKAASPGKGYWTFMHQAGATFYFDERKAWSVSARGRFLHSTEDPDTDIRPGNEAIFEYGLGKDVPLGGGAVLTAGLIGYSYIQLTKDSGPGASGLKAEGHALGPELQLSVFEPFFLNVSLRYTREYEVRNNTEGDSVCLTIVASF
ncbi:Uncharacterized conserved protein [Desulfacinum infernum DSM 9756]|uniref:Uncharacterized conserved protein n=1 Tax=Desulfacinum infernum DSM 9756 TaxID=1121391 RepID=A0A1M5G669_9BACT|nr:transporter [Desulfacinum infernum]SHF99208.1 Uncharacterized conserved protein [Desulfacinum infernum DSM 9756]